MMRKSVMAGILSVLGFFLFLFTGAKDAHAIEQKIYDEAHLLDEAEIENLEQLAEELGQEIETDLIVLTYSSPMDEKDYTDDFYQANAPGYNMPHGSAVILTINMESRELYLGSFKYAAEYLTPPILEDIRDTVIPYLSDGDFYQAFETYMYTVYEYMTDFSQSPGDEGSIPPSYGGNFPSNEGYVSQSDNIFGQLWFQIIVSVVIGIVVVGFMAMNAGGKVTVNERTYLNQQTSRVLRRRDDYIRTTVTKRRKPSNNNKSSGSGGFGGSFGGGSHGVRGKF